MTKHKEEAEIKEVKVNQPDGAPIAPDAADVAPSRETLSHQWQKDSPAINTNVLAGYGNQQNIADVIDTPEKKKAREAAEELKHDLCATYSDEARTRLDVSHPCYRNPSQDYETKSKK